ncbi:MAG TPA: phosphate ABC transporter permease PstA [Rhizomicrobium sp.]|nr:phosphate ABC transporter permease PstA [Rhizomicrobium sp.]
MNRALYARRRIRNTVFLTLSVAAAVFGIAWLALILYSLIAQGIQALSSHIFTEMTPAQGSTGGGLINAIAGSLIMSALAVVVGTPIGIFGGTYLAEYGRHSRLSVIVRFINDILLSAPSILIGLFIYQIAVAPMHGFSAWAGMLALAVIVIPVVVRTTENMLHLVPNTLREASAALGSPRNHVIRTVTWRAARAGMITGVLLAVARISGETAPLLFTALGNNGWSSNTLALGKNLSINYPAMNSPMASLPLVIFNFASSADDNQHRLAWTGALIITFAVLTLSIVARIFGSEKEW